MKLQRVRAGRAVWVWRVPDFRGGFAEHRTRVEIVGATERRYLVRLLEFGPRGAAPGYVTRVSKRSVLLRDGALPVPAVPPDATRLPYRD